MTKTVLLIEDNPDDIVLTRRALDLNNLVNDVIVRQDGVEAIEYLADEANTVPALILLDLNLPRRNGIEVLSEIRRNPRTALVPVVVMTTSKEESDLVRSYRLGANSYIVKPVDFERFLNATRQLGMYWLLLNEAPLIAGGADG